MAATQRFYWLGHGKPSEQDQFFIEALDSDLWSQGDHNNWDTCWYTGMPDKPVFAQLDANKTINHIPGNSALTIKSNLYKTLIEARQRVAGTAEETRYSFFPETFSMPEEYFRYQEQAAKHPQNLWIQKPRNLSRGRGIEVVQYPEAAPLSSEWIIQRYLPEPHLFDGHKYVLRCYVLITSTEPLRFYLYQEGFAKLASETYNEDDLENLYRHLTNPDINEENTDAETPVTFYSFAQYRQWLRDQGHDDQALFAQLKDLVSLSVIAAREKMRSQSRDVDANMLGAYELIGLDCMVDKHLKPWILECNLSPSLETCSSGDDHADVETQIKRQLVFDLVDLLGLNETTQEITDANSKAAYETEHQGNFERLFPSAESNNYLNCFPVPRYQDIASLNTLCDVDLHKLALRPLSDHEFLFEDSLALYTRDKIHYPDDPGSFIVPNETATWIWLKNAAGASPEQIANELHQTTPKPDGISSEAFLQHLLEQVWGSLADWAQAGLFAQHSTTQHSTTQSSTTQYSADAHSNLPAISNDWVNSYLFAIGNDTIVLHFGCKIAANYLHPILKPVPLAAVDNAVLAINILPSSYGYSLASGNTLIAESLKLSELFFALLRIYANYSGIYEAGMLQYRCLLQATLIQHQDSHTLIVSNHHDLLDHAIYQLAQSHPLDIVSGSVILNEQPGWVEATGLPVRLPAKGELSYRKAFNQATDIVVETQGAACFLRELDTTTLTDNTFKVNNVIIVDKYANKEQTLDSSTSPVSSAELLTALWNCHIGNQVDAAKQLANWLDDSVTAVKISGDGHAAIQLQLQETIQKIIQEAGSATSHHSETITRLSG